MKKERLFFGIVLMVIFAACIMLASAATTSVSGSTYKPVPCDSCGKTACGVLKCIGVNQYQCQDGQWLLANVNVASCGYTPPTPPTPPATKFLTTNLHGTHDLIANRDLPMLEDSDTVMPGGVLTTGKTITLTGGSVNGGFACIIQNKTDGTWTTGSSVPGASVGVSFIGDPLTTLVTKEFALPITAPITLENVRYIRVFLNLPTPVWQLGYTPNPDDYRTFASWDAHATATYIVY